MGQSFQLGAPDADLEQVRPLQPGEGTGTTVTYWASQEIFETTTYSLEDHHHPDPRVRLPQQGARDRGPGRAPRRGRAARGRRRRDGPADVDQAGSDAIQAGEGGGLRRVFKYDRGLVDYVEHLNRRKDKANPTVISFEAETAQGQRQPHVALRWPCSGTRTFTELGLHTFANTINTHEGGTHEEGFRTSLTWLVNRTGAELGLIKSARTTSPARMFVRVLRRSSRQAA